MQPQLSPNANGADRRIVALATMYCMLLLLFLQPVHASGMRLIATNHTLCPYNVSDRSWMTFQSHKVDLQLYWRINSSQDTITLLAEAATQGYISIGVSMAYSMPGKLQTFVERIPPQAAVATIEARTSYS